MVALVIFLLVWSCFGLYNFVCRDSNEFYNLINKKYSRRFDTVEDALKNIGTESSLLVLSDGYPDTQVEISSTDYSEMYQKNITLFVEYPSSYPGLQLGTPSSTNQYFRTMVYKNTNLKYLKPEYILKIQGKKLIPVQNCESLACISTSFLVTGRIAGYNILPYGFPPSNQMQSILLQQDKNQEQQTPKSLISLTSITTDFFEARYSPLDEIRLVFLELLNYLEPIKTSEEEEILPKHLNSSVIPLFSSSEILPSQTNIYVLKNAINYLTNENLLIKPPNPKTKDLCILKPKTNIDYTNNTCMLSGYETSIDYHGNQPICDVVRIDCVAETSMSLGLGGKIFRQINLTNYASDLMDYIFLNSYAQRKDSSKASYGLISWGMPSDAWYTVFYGDDNARVLISTILTSSVLSSKNGNNNNVKITNQNYGSKYDESILMGMLGNLRTSSWVTGFRPHRLDEKALEKSGWKVYFDNPVHVKTAQPHFDAYLWALFLWGYEKTKGKLFLETAEKGIRKAMELYNDQTEEIRKYNNNEESKGGKWTWTETITEEQARMILPLAWYVRVSGGTAESLGWLKGMAQDLLSSQEEKSGAIREVLGVPGRCQYCPPKSNDDYGTHESPIIQENGNPASDLLYTTPFAFFGLLEAFYATNDSFYLSALEKLESFLLRIQVKSNVDHLQYLSGGWLRAFDFEKWEFWGSSGDIGWGAYSQTTGWTETWISSVIALKEMKTSLWDYSMKNNLMDKSLYEKVCPSFFSGIIYSKFCETD